MRVRFAPSPTGALHIGGARTALFNWLLARHEGGELVLRIEDTDRERSTPENIEQILDALRWLELDWDEGPIMQTALGERHQEALKALLEAGLAYRSNATAEDVKAYKERHGADRGFRGEPEAEGAVRLRVPDEGATVVHDAIRGDTRFEHVHMDDPVIARADGSVLYNFAVAIDDLDAGITHVVRGEDHLSNTPKQLLVIEAARAAGLHADDAAAALRAPAAAARPRRQEALQAPRRRVGAGAARRRLPARGGTQLPRAARLGRRRRQHGALDRRAGRALHARPREPQPGALRRGEAALAERRLHPLAARGGARAARSEAFTGRDGLEQAARISQEKIHTLADFWPLAGPLLDEPVDDPKARERWLDEKGRAALAEARAGARRGRSPSTSRRSSRRWAS